MSSKYDTKELLQRLRCGGGCEVVGIDVLAAVEGLITENLKMRFDLNLIAEGLDPASYIYNKIPRLTEGSEYVVRDCLNRAKKYKQHKEDNE